MAKMSRADWRKCEGVNKRTGRTKPGYRVVKGSCPQPVAKAKTKAKTAAKKATPRKKKAKAAYYTGGDYGRGYERYAMAQKYDNPDAVAKYYMSQIRPDLEGARRRKKKSNGLRALFGLGRTRRRGRR